MNRKFLALALLLATTCFAPVRAAEKYDFTAIMHELQAMSNDNQRLQMIMWVPTEFWLASAQSTADSSEKTDSLAKLRAMVDPYLMVVVVQASMGPMGTMTFPESAEMRKTVFIEDAAGGRVDPLDEKALTKDVLSIRDILKPIFSNMLGNLGQHVELVVFPATDPAGRRYVDSARDGKLVVHLGDFVHKYRLPLASLMPPVIDPATGDSFPGNYHFNPYTGAKLAPSKDK